METRQFVRAQIIPHKIGKLACGIRRCLFGLARLALAGDGSVSC